MSRLELVTECEHGRDGWHYTMPKSGMDWSGGLGPECPGGSRILLDPDRAMVIVDGFGDTQDVTVQDVLDALEKADSDAYQDFLSQPEP